jgi:hypothetical protein
MVSYVSPIENATGTPLSTAYVPTPLYIRGLKVVIPFDPTSINISEGGGGGGGGGPIQFCKRIVRPVRGSYLETVLLNIFVLLILATLRCGQY